MLKFNVMLKNEEFIVMLSNEKLFVMLRNEASQGKFKTHEIFASILSTALALRCFVPQHDKAFRVFMSKGFYHAEVFCHAEERSISRKV